MKGVTSASATKFVDTLRYADNVLITDKGSLFRIASIVVDDRFTDEVTVNPTRSYNSTSEEAAQDKLNAGLFVVGEKTQSSED